MKPRHSSFCRQLGNGGLQFKKALDNTDADQFETPSVAELGFAKLCTVAQQMARGLQTSHAEAAQAGIIWVETCSMVLEWPVCSDKPHRLLPARFSHFDRRRLLLIEFVFERVLLSKFYGISSWVSLYIGDLW